MGYHQKARWRPYNSSITLQCFPKPSGAQLVANERSQKRRNPTGWEISTELQVNSQNLSLLSRPFNLDELYFRALQHLKNGKAAGPDDILTVFIKNLCENGLKWLLNMFNSCVSQERIPRLWQRAQVVALLQPGKDPE